MATRPPTVPYEITNVAGNVVIWGRADYITEFFPSADALTTIDKAPSTVTTRATTVRRYPGDPNPFSRAAASVAKYPKIPKSNGTTPGKRFWIETTTIEAGGTKVTKRRQMTYVGNFSGLRNEAQLTATRPYVLRNQSGAAYEIADATP